VSPVGFGAFKIGRNQGIKYAADYELPSDAEVDRLLHGVLDLGINLIDTAPAYGLSEQRVGKVLGARTDVVISTKVGERFESGESAYDFSAEGVRESVERSLRRLRRERLDIVFVHAHGGDAAILSDTPVVETLCDLRDHGLIAAIGFSGKTPGAAERACDWADVLMVEYHLSDRSHEQVLQSARSAEIGVVVKKALASGNLPPDEAITFAASNPAVGSVVIGSLSLDHLRRNLAAAEAAIA
jgi:aryl-alcohol dehydrogenase-like predicted oxidoreductase